MLCALSVSWSWWRSFPCKNIDLEESEALLAGPHVVALISFFQSSSLLSLNNSYLVCELWLQICRKAWRYFQPEGEDEVGRLEWQQRDVEGRRDEEIRREGRFTLWNQHCCDDLRERKMMSTGRAKKRFEH